MKIGLYSPYIHILGGGERYILSIADTLAQKNNVTLFSPTSIREKALSMFGISLKHVHFESLNIFQAKNALRKYLALKNFDVIFYITDGSFFFSGAKKNFLMIQSPIHIPRLTYLNRLKLRNWKIICYSEFMQKIIADKLQQKAIILSPCVDMQKFKYDISLKENIILTVGRFFPYPHNKKQDLLIDIFKKNYHKYFKNWKMIIAGGLTEEGGMNVLADLKKKAKRLPIEIVINPGFNQLIRLYKRAKLYWHAAGFREDIKLHPERVEHFGITTLEAMAAGVVPFGFAAGGQEDIIDDGENGYLWDSEDELVQKTYQTVNSEKQLNGLSKQAIARAAYFSCEKFHAKLEKIITG